MPETILLDTDIDTDCDDAGALAVLHTLASRGEARILGIICDIPDRRTAGCVYAINAWYGHPEIPLGIYSTESLADSPRYAAYRAMLEQAEQGGFRRYNGILAAEYGKLAPRPLAAEPSLTLYRRLLAGEPDGSVTIVAIGLLTALAELLSSPPDEVSPLSGIDLVRAKVRCLVTMGLGSFPSGQDVFNWKMDLSAAATVLNNWPGPLVVSEWGETVLTGAGLSERLPVGHPIRRAYEIYLGGPGSNRSSWDQVAMLYAVQGAQDCFTEHAGYTLQFDQQSGKHTWAEDPASQHGYLSLAIPADQLARRIEDLMTGG